MIELNFKADTMHDLQAALFDAANTLAQGRMMQSAQAAHAAQPPAPSATDPTVARDPQPVPVAAPKSAKKKPEPAPTPLPVSDPEPDQIDIEDVLAVHFVEKEEIAQPLPSTTDELRVLAMEAMKKIGNDPAAAVIRKFAPKLTDIKGDAIAECGKALLKAMG